MPVGSARAARRGRRLPDAIPDSAIAQYDATTESSTGGISTINDEVGTFDLSGSCEVISNGINGQNTFRFDGADDVMSNSDISASIDPWAVLMVGRTVSLGGGDFIWNRDNSDPVGIQENDDIYNVYRDNDGNFNPLDGEQTDTNPHIWVYEAINGNEVSFEVDGSDNGSNTQNNADLEGFSVAHRPTDGYVELDVGEAVILENYTSSDLNSETERLHDKWGFDFL